MKDKFSEWPRQDVPKWAYWPAIAQENKEYRLSWIRIYRHGKYFVLPVKTYKDDNNKDSLYWHHQECLNVYDYYKNAPTGL